MDGQVHGRIRKERSRNITSARFSEAGRRNAGLVGSTLRVLVTETGKNGTMIGRTGNYRPVVLPEGSELGSFVNVLITGCEPTHLTGVVSGSPE